MSNKNIKKKVDADGDNIAVLKVYRENGFVVLRIKVSESIENCFKTDEVKESMVYRSNGDRLSYYAMNIADRDNMASIESKMSVFMCDYGGELFRSGRPNFSVLRTVGVSSSNGVKMRVDGLIGSDAIKKYVELFKKFLAEFYKQYISRVSVETTLNIVEL